MINAPNKKKDSAIIVENHSTITLESKVYKEQRSKRLDVAINERKKSKYVRRK